MKGKIGDLAAQGSQAWEAYTGDREVTHQAPDSWQVDDKDAACLTPAGKAGASSSSKTQHG
jgi:hypothetical protein